MNFPRFFLCLFLAGLGLAWPVTAQEILEGKPEKALAIGCLTYRDTSGQLLRVREFSYELDTLTGEAVVRERISDTSGTKAVIVNSYEGTRLAQKEEYDKDGQFLKRTRYKFVTFAEEAYPSLMTVETFQPDSLVNGSQIRYSDTAGYHFPLEIIRWTSGKPADRIRYTYPFCPPAHYGPMADSLLARGMPGAILSVTHWRDSVRTDSTAVVYGHFPGTDTCYLRPAALLYAEGTDVPDTCVRYMAYDSLGLQPVQIHDRRGTGFRSMDPRQFRWMAPDPAAERMRVLRAYDYCAADPWLHVDATQGDNFLFDETGSFLCRVQSPLVNNQVIFWQGYGLEPLSARFADPVHDPGSIGMDTQVKLVTPEMIRTSLDKAGAFVPAHHGLFKGSWYMYRNSKYGGLLDFAVNGQHDIIDRIFYITRTSVEGNVAHNNYNYGNFLWGATACELGIPLFLSRLGAHFNNFFLSPDTKGTFDAKDDQFSIHAGYHWK